VRIATSLNAEVSVKMVELVSGLINADAQMDMMGYSVTNLSVPWHVPMTVNVSEQACVNAAGSGEVHSVRTLCVRD